MRVLFTVPPTHPAVADYGAILTSHVHERPVNPWLSASYPIPSWGLHWIKENCPTVEVLDMPGWGDIERELKKGVDVLGVGFYTYQVPDAIRLVQMARRYGVREIWGGNYGTQTPGVDIYFDRIIQGNAEAEVHRLLYGKELEELKHPTVLQTWKLGGRLGRLIRFAGYSWTRSGVLWTIKGCYYNCNFCVSPGFIGKTRNRISLAEIARVLDRYVALKIPTVSVMDLDFLMDRKYAAQVIGLLKERKLRWTCMTRVDHIQGRIGQLREDGCEIVFVGVESLNVKNLAEQNKYRFDGRESLLRLFDELREHEMGYYLFYMLGFEHDTYQSLKDEIDFISSLHATFYQFQVVTPLPGSKMFEEYRSRVINWDWADWNCNTLVWKHPHITAEQMDELLVYAKRKTSLARLLRGYFERGTLDDSFQGLEIWRTLLKLWFARVRRPPKAPRPSPAWGLPAERPPADDVAPTHDVAAAE